MPKRSRFAQTQLDFDAPIQAPAAPVQKINRFAPLPDLPPLPPMPSLFERIGVDDVPTITAVVPVPELPEGDPVECVLKAQAEWLALVEVKAEDIRAEAARRQAHSARMVGIAKIEQRLLASTAFPVEPKRPSRLISGAAPAVVEMMERWEEWNDRCQAIRRQVRAQAEAMYDRSQSPAPAAVASLPPLPPISRSRQR